MEDTQHGVITAHVRYPAAMGSLIGRALALIHVLNMAALNVQVLLKRSSLATHARVP